MRKETRVVGAASAVLVGGVWGYLLGHASEERGAGTARAPSVAPAAVGAAEAREAPQVERGRAVSGNPGRGSVAVPPAGQRRRVVVRRVVTVPPAPPAPQVRTGGS